MQISMLAHSPLLPVMVYLLAAVGCLLCLLCVDRVVERTTGWRRAGWLALGAWAIGSTVIWDMYLLVAAELGRDDLRIRYALQSIFAGVGLAIASAAVGLLLVNALRDRVGRSLFGGATLGAAVAAGDFAALQGLRVNAEVSYRPGVVAATIGVAMAATAAAVALATRRDSPGSTVLGAAVLTLVVTGTHYLSLASLTIGPSTSNPVGGIRPIGLVVPIMIQLVIRVIVLLMVLPTSRGVRPGIRPTHEHALPAARRSGSV